LALTVFGAGGGVLLFSGAGSIVRGRCAAALTASVPTRSSITLNLIYVSLVDRGFRLTAAERSQRFPGQGVRITEPINKRRRQRLFEIISPIPALCKVTTKAAIANQEQ